ncbi:SO_0444 family Cu/Zn efflux transporter [Thalassotalea agarivorans]|uniref:Permease n=1 Tax=Thalassotalea agarivorans TaxID=349064 RepID=A0A1I0ALI7_THASX|nr:SO_0444 family Cu/Zn efflux transporter [Thalassotalea agarivorans]SES95145.1 hypothetical protein SAMN05660429_00749 [Thalassotalea agarivorans]
MVELNQFQDAVFTLMQIVNQFFANLVQLSAEASPWLLLGLLIAGLMKAWVPTRILSHHLGSGKKAIVKAAFIGAPLPLCSCGVIPVATELKRSGASAPATSSFLVATPETGVDSVSVSYAMLGPVMAIYRPIAAIISAIATGLLVNTTTKTATSNQAEVKSCCASHQQEAPKKEETSCCSHEHSHQPTSMDKTISGIKYASTTLIDDIVKWLAIGLLFATIVRTFVPESFLLSYGSGLPAMLLMIAISIPMYICATASTPIAAGFIMAGISPGTALVFMMAGPATNISTLGVIKSEMGTPVLTRYLLGISVSAIALGLLLDAGLSYFDINIANQMSHSHELLPQWFGILCALVIIILAVKPIRRLFIK